MKWDAYEKKLRAYGYDDESLAVIRPAFEFATLAHAEEKRYSGDPYIGHPIEVSLGIASMHLDAATVAAGLLHDVIENQNIPIEDVRKKFGEDVAFLVDGVTKVDRVRYRGVERAVESIRKMVLALAEDIRVVIIKLMDRLHNMKTLQHVPTHKQQRIALETLEIFAPLADRLGMWEMKAELEDLAFPYLFPKEYEWLVGQVKERRLESESYLEKLKPLVEKELLKENVRANTIVYRTKHLYSIWKKLLRNEMNFDRLLDIVAMRIIVESVEDCYRVLGIIHKLWRPMPGRIKDYIALPKPNGYQSIHTTVFGPEGKVVDFQIRTVDMDQEAEHGIAAHWAYDAMGKKKALPKLDERKYAWVRQLQEWQQEHKHGEENSEETLRALKIDFFKDRIFVMTPKGDVIDLPEGSTPVDFAYHIHSEVGNHMFGAKVNGKMVPFSYQLKSGSTAEIITQKNKHPTKDWLDYAHTTIARNRIRQYLRKTEELDSDTREKYLAEAIVVAKNRVGLLKDIAQVFSNFKISIVEHKSDHQTKSFSRISAKFLPRKNISLSAILTELRKIKNVESVTINEHR